MTSTTKDRWCNVTGCELKHALDRPGRIGLARLCKQVFDIGMQRGPHCGGEPIEIVAAILPRSTIEEYLAQLGWILNHGPECRPGSQGGTRLAALHAYSGTRATRGCQPPRPLARD